LLHGAFEFGKDFIAKGTHDGALCQFAFQTKAGDLGLSDWNGCRGQIDMLRTNSLAHPGFDRALPRQAVFVTTGRLVGAAALAAQEYGKHLQQLGESGFLVWDKEILVDFISANPEIGLGGNSEGALLAALGHIDQNRIREIEIERFSRRWFSKESSFPLYRATLEDAILGNRLRRHDRLDLACFAALCLVRASWASAHGLEPPDALGILVADTGRALFFHYASELFSRCDDNTFDPRALIQLHEPLAAYATYPVRCMRLVEIIGLLGLIEEGESDRRKAIVDFLLRLFQTNPGTSHPISDHWAVSLIPPVLLLAAAGYRQQVRDILEHVIRWICDRYQGDNFGLAEAHSTPEEEVTYLLGTPFEHVTLQRRNASYTATVVLDLAAMMEMNELFELAINDFLAVHAMPPVIEVSDTSGVVLNSRSTS
jgi:hypothetical protein